MTLGSDGLGALSEHLLNVYILVMVWLLQMRRTTLVSLLFGAAIGLALHTNYLSGPLLAALGLFFLWRERRQPLRWVASAAGLVLVTAAVLMPIVLWSSISDYIHLQREFLSGYTIAPTPWTVVVQRFQRFLAPTLQVALVSIVLGLLVPAARTRAAAKWALLLAVGIIASSTNGFFWSHYALLLAPATVFLLGSQLRAVPGRANAVAAVALLIATWSLVVPVIGPMAEGAGAISRQHNLLPDHQSDKFKVAEALSQDFRPGEVMYTRDLHYYYLTDAKLPTRFFFPSHHTNFAYTVLRGTTPDAEMRGIVAKHPKVVVLDQVGRVAPNKDRVLRRYLDQDCKKRLVQAAEIYNCD
jgi:hypothetical protein